MSTKPEEYFEDRDYQRYYQMYGEEEFPEPEVEDDEWGAADLLDNDELSDAEEAFLRGFS